MAEQSRRVLAKDIFAHVLDRTGVILQGINIDGHGKCMIDACNQVIFSPYFKESTIRKMNGQQKAAAITMAILSDRDPKSKALAVNRILLTAQAAIHLAAMQDGYDRLFTAGQEHPDRFYEMLADCFRQFKMENEIRIGRILRMTFMQNMRSAL